MRLDSWPLIPKTTQNPIVTNRKPPDPTAATSPPAVPADSAAPIDFEKALADLESLVEKLEQGDLPLDESLKAFERGVELTRHCQVALKQAEQKVEILLRRTGQPEPFATAGDADSTANDAG
jgi:exodeoxyribonuclease VII small subunit